MITKVGEDWLKAIREFSIEELIQESQEDEFSAYLSSIWEGDQDKIVVRFLMEDWKSHDTLCLLGYVWAIWHIDGQLNITDIEILMPEQTNLDIPEQVGDAKYFVAEGAVSI